MPRSLKVGFRWILRAKTADDADAAVDILKHMGPDITHVRRSGSEVRWSTEGELPRLVPALRGVVGQLERRRHSSYAARRVILPAPTADELGVLRDALGRGGHLPAAGDSGDDALEGLAERGWVEPIPGTACGYRLTPLGRRWATLEASSSE